MKKLIILLIFLGFISPNVWGNNLYQEYNLSKYYLDNDYRFHLCSKSNSQLHLNSTLTIINEFENYCNQKTSFSRPNIIISFRFKKSKDTRFTMNIQGGISLGFQNEKRNDGTMRLKFHTNIGGKYDWGFIQGKYKIIGRILTPDSFLQLGNNYFKKTIYSSFTYERIPYIGIEITF